MINAREKIIVVPGNGNTNVEKDMWFLWLKNQLKNKNMNVICRNMPDPELARKKYWLPFIEKELKADAQSIVIGHSSGAVAALRYLENHKLRGVIIVGAYYTDLGYEEEKKSGYFDDDWNWAQIKKNADWIVQFASQNDPYISTKESRYVHQKLNCEYHEYKDLGHFGNDVNMNEFPQLMEVIERKTRL